MEIIRLFISETSIKMRKMLYSGDKEGTTDQNLWQWTISYWWWLMWWHSCNFRGKFRSVKHLKSINFFVCSGCTGSFVRLKYWETSSPLWVFISFCFGFDAMRCVEMRLNEIVNEPLLSPTNAIWFSVGNRSSSAITCYFVLPRITLCV